MNEVAWKQLEDDKDRKQPTPPIGTPIQWYQAGDKSAVYAGIVTGIEGPGRLKVVVFPINTFPQHKTAVHHVSHPVHDKPGNSTTKNGGSWDYAPGTKPNSGHYKFHEEELYRREANLVQMDENAKKAAEEFAQKQEERRAARKKIVSPEPLPASV